MRSLGVSRPILGRLPFQRSVANVEPASLCRLGRFPGDDHHLPEADRYAANLAFEPEKSITCVSVPAQSGAPRKVGLQTDLATKCVFRPG